MIVVVADSRERVQGQLKSANVKYADLRKETSLPPAEAVGLVLLHDEHGRFGPLSKTWPEWRDHWLSPSAQDRLVIEFSGSNLSAVEVLESNRHWRCSRKAVEECAARLLTQFQKTGRWDEKCMKQDGRIALTAAIHELHNLPVCLDAETAADIAGTPAEKTGAFIPDCVAMWRASFAGVPPRILCQIGRIPERRDDAGWTVDDYLRALRSPVSVSAAIESGGWLEQLVASVKREFIAAYGEPSDEQPVGMWQETVKAGGVPALKPLQVDDDDNVNAIQALSWALCRIATDLDSELIAPLRGARRLAMPPEGEEGGAS